MAAPSASASAAPPLGEMPAPTSSACEPIPSPAPASARQRRRGRVREVSSRYLSTPLPTPSPRLSTSSFSSSSSTPATRARHHCTPAPFVFGLADENRPPPKPGSRKRGATPDLFDEMHRPRVIPPAPLGVSGATATPSRRSVLRPSRVSTNVATPAQQHRRVCARPSTPARTSLYSASSQTSAAAIESWGATPCPRRVPCPELRSSPPGTTEESGPPPNPFCFQALRSALPDCQAKIPALLVKPPPSLAARQMVLVKKGAAVMGGSKAAGDVHKLRILNSRYMQYRFLNAQAEAVAVAKNAVAKKLLCGISERIADLQKSVALKKVELECLKRVEKVNSIVDAQVPSLEQWIELEREHASCLAEGTAALRDTASRLPILGNIKTNIGGVKLALNSATEIMKQLSPCAEKLSRKAGEIKDVASELNSAVSNEKVLLQECADLLHEAHDMQVMEDSLRIRVMHLKNETKNET